MAPVGGKRVKKGILERLNSGEVVIGDGSFVFTLEKRGYVKAGRWTPEAAVEYPEAVRQLHTEYLRAGSNVMQTFTFFAGKDNLESKWKDVNEAACDLAREVAEKGDALVAGGISETSLYKSHKDKLEIKEIFQQQLEVFTRKNVDFLIAEYFEYCKEAVWAVEVLKESGKPVAATMCIGPEGDMNNLTPGECAVRLVKAGLEPRLATRWDIQKYAREAYNLGVRYIGGCCGFEPYHIRAIAEELAPERGFLPDASEKHGSWGSGLSMHTKPWIRARAQKEYWKNLLPASGRPHCPSLSKPDA
ncbi:betaine--homocysteine S-methyltransferase 1-like isoform X2 [Trichosurus vulpecula]|uniref:betaine--homocysteine S-methyltransferase 1-like isoform X2 n=1 Tax=Trichosurus vulpecula TaxID=9337 RepID=UPI00186B5064|nr:betaine--homocysteine S-methyltransferase 1-like isoform X2 [Trichosurus vulpecula]